MTIRQYGRSWFSVYEVSGKYLGMFKTRTAAKQFIMEHSK